MQMCNMIKIALGKKKKRSAGPAYCGTRNVLNRLIVGTRAEGKKFFFSLIFCLFFIQVTLDAKCVWSVQILEWNCVIAGLFPCHLSVQNSAQPRWGWLLLCAAANAFYSRLVGHYSQCCNTACMWVSFHLALIHRLRIIAEQMCSSSSLPDALRSGLLMRTTDPW